MDQQYQNFIRAIRNVCSAYINMLDSQEERCRLDEYGPKSQPGTLKIILDVPEYPVPVRLYTPEGEVPITGSYSYKANKNLYDLDKEIRRMIGTDMIESSGDSYTVNLAILDRVGVQ